MKQKNTMQFQPSRVARKIDVTDLRAAYDENVKWLLSEKIFLAHIMVYAVKEYKGMNPWDVCELIEGEPQVGKVAVNPGETNTAEIVGDNVENTVPNEGKITYDIRFHAWAPGKDKLIELLIDIEAHQHQCKVVLEAHLLMEAVALNLKGLAKRLLRQKNIIKSIQ